ncbi:MAG: DMT family transporter [Alphaproteobacteria bacterium]|nr:DMT family transporter [Alphaproteobacteria bacterium]
MFDAFHRLPGPARGGIWMLGASLFFGTHGPLVRFSVGEGADPLVVAFWRSLVVFLLMLPWILRNRDTALRSKRPVGQILRGFYSMVGLILLVLSQARLPLAEVSALTFAAPLFGTIGAALLLGESVRAPRWIATIVGFVGVWVVLRPGVSSVDPWFALPLISAVFIAASNLMIRSLSKDDPPNTTIAWLAMVSVPATLLPALFVWSWPTPEALFWMAMLGVAGLGAHICLTRAFTAAEASAVLPYDYSRLIVTASLGFILFGEVPTLWTWIGGAIIVGAVVYMARRGGARAKPATPAGET